MVDLSYIQFICKYDLSDKSSREEVIENYKSLYKDPWKAVKIEHLPNSPVNGISFPQGEYSEINPDPLKSINDYSIEEMEDAFPERFNKFK